MDKNYGKGRGLIKNKYNITRPQKYFIFGVQGPLIYKLMGLVIVPHYIRPSFNIIPTKTSSTILGIIILTLSLSVNRTPRGR